MLECAVILCLVVQGHVVAHQLRPLGWTAPTIPWSLAGTAGDPLRLPRAVSVLSSASRSSG